MELSPQFDPALKRILLERSGHPLGAEMGEEMGRELIPVIARLRDPHNNPPGLQVVTRAGAIVTGRVALAQIVSLRHHPNIVSLKASRLYAPTPYETESEMEELPFESDQFDPPAPSRRPMRHSEITGRGTVVAILDWGLDFAHPNFIGSDGRSRVLALWDQRGGPQPSSPSPFGYGRVHSRADIEAALTADDPYSALGYDPAQSDPLGLGTHGTHTCDIAVGSGLLPGSVAGVAPGADLVFVHLKADDTAVTDTLGDSVRIIEGVHYALATAQGKPLVVNMSLGRTGGPHDSSPLIVQAFDHLVRSRPNLAIVMSAGNYFESRKHASALMATGATVTLPFDVPEGRTQVVEIEAWYAQSDRLHAELIDPSGETVIRAGRGEDQTVSDANGTLVSVFHRAHEPNNNDHVVNAIIYPGAAAGRWTLNLLGEEIVDGRVDAWIERVHKRSQARFPAEIADPTMTTGSICNGLATLSVGAFDLSDPEFPLGPFSSSGPTRDRRNVPVLSAHGRRVKAARSSTVIEGVRRPGALTTMSGTSMAAPHVAGAIALLYEASGVPLNVDTVRQVLTTTADRLPPWRPEDELRYGLGRLNLDAALDQIRTMSTPLESQSILTEGDLSVESDLACAEGFEADLGAVGCRHGESNDESPRRSLLEYAEAEFAREVGGALAYQPGAPLWFAPTGEAYGYDEPRSAAANLVYNAAHEAGLSVPTFAGATSQNGSTIGYVNVDQTFEALMGNLGPGVQNYFEQYFEVVAAPGSSASPRLEPGDIVIGPADVSEPAGLMALVAEPQFRMVGDPSLRGADAGAGYALVCVDAGPNPHRAGDRYGRVVLDDDGRVLPNRLIARFRDDRTGWAPPSMPPERESMAEAVPDAATAANPFTAAKKRALKSPVMDAAANAAAITWNARKHPSDSGIDPVDIRSALANYVDLAEVSSAITAFNTANPSRQIAAGTAPVDAVFVEAIRQFQADIFVEASKADGMAGESTLDSLGFIRRTGMQTVDTPNSRAQSRLNARDASVKSATGNEFTAANWFQNMVNGAFLGRQARNGIHAVLARQLRQAEAALAAAKRSPDQTPAELGRTYGVTENFGGARPNARSASMHTFGLAVDINYTGNPWVAGQHVDRDASGPSPAGLITQQANQEFTQAVNHAALLISGVVVNFTASFLSGLNARTTGQIYDEILARHNDFVAYLALNGNATGIASAIAARVNAGTAGVVNSGESQTDAAQRWLRTIATDLANLRQGSTRAKNAAGNEVDVDRSNFSGRDPRQGFLNLDRDLVIVLRDTVGLAWGAVDFGTRESGDMMHFDARRSGVGRVLN